jgi:hypothetical protein
MSVGTTKEPQENGCELNRIAMDLSVKIEQAWTEVILFEAHMLGIAPESPIPFKMDGGVIPDAITTLRNANAFVNHVTAVMERVYGASVKSPK